jgi:hypothetical protein
MAAGHEVAGAGHAGRLDEKLAVGANGLKAVMLDNERLSRHEAQNERRERRASGMDDVRLTNELPDLNEAWMANRKEWICAVVEIPGRSLRDKGNFELRRTVRIAESSEAAGKRKNDGLDATNAWCKKMRIEQELHSETLRGVSVGASLTLLPAAL